MQQMFVGQGPRPSRFSHQSRRAAQPLVFKCFTSRKSPQGAQRLLTAFPVGSSKQLGVITKNAIPGLDLKLE
jgi:hypothetical protein